MKLCIFTSEYEGNTPSLALLRESCARVGVTLHTYGQGPWPGWLAGKTRDGIAFLESVAGDFTHAMWVDGFDSLVLAPPQIIERTYEGLTDRVIVASELNCWPLSELSEQFPVREGKRFVNAGGYMGPIPLLIQEMQKVIGCCGPHENDQYGWSLRYLEAWPRIQLDTKSLLWRSMSDPDDGGPSCVRHWNGQVPGREEFWRKYA